MFSVQFEGEPIHEFAKCFELWNDPIYLQEFFERNYQDLCNPFWNGITIEEAIIKTRRDARILEKELLYIAQTGKTERLETLSTIFEPLSKDVIQELEKDKAKGLERNSWLRIYAIRVEANLFVVSGGAIKLTKTMNETKHLLLELEKLEVTKQFLKNDDNDEIEFIEIS